MKAVMRARLGAAAILARLKAVPGVDVIAVDSEAELAAAIADAELLLVPDSFYSAETAQILRERAKKLQWIQLLTAGYDAVARHGYPSKPSSPMPARLSRRRWRRKRSACCSACSGNSRF